MAQEPSLQALAVLEHVAQRIGEPVPAGETFLSSAGVPLGVAALIEGVAREARAAVRREQIILDVLDRRVV